MTAVAFDTLKFARSLQEKAKMSAEQAEGFADALVDVLDGNLATKGDIRDVQANIRDVRADIAALRLTNPIAIENRSLVAKADIGSVAEAVTSAKNEIVRWFVGAIGLQTLVYLYAFVIFAEALR